MNSHIKAVDINNVWKFFNLGGTVLVEGKHGDDIDVMPASWSMPIDYNKLGVVLDSTHYTRKLIEKEGYFLLALPTVKIVKELMYLGSNSKNDVDDKVEQSGLKFFNIEGCDFPLPEGCVAWAVCKVLKEPHNEKTYDLFIGEVVAGYADDRIFNDKGEPTFETAGEELSILPNFGGAYFYSLGKRVSVPGY